MGAVKAAVWVSILAGCFWRGGRGIPVKDVRGVCSQWPGKRVKKAGKR